MKLGEMLVRSGKLTPVQVEEALKGQAIFGGRFGTNLVEMGYLEEDELADILSKKSGVPHASLELLNDIPPHVVRLIPEEVVKKYRVVPIAINNRKLTVAMADPSDFATIDEISFLTGFIVVPVITPELRLVNALEKYYRIKRELRYIKVDGGGRNRARLAPAVAPVPPRQAAPATPPPGSRPAEPEEEILELPTLAEYEVFGALEEVALQMPQRVSAAPLPHPPSTDYGLEAVLRGLSEARDRHGVAELIVGYASRQFDRSALFLLKGANATGWVAHCAKKEVPGFEKLEIPLSEPSVLRVVAQSKSHYQGPMPMTAGNVRIISALGGGAPMNNLLVPLIMMGRVVAILYVEGGTLRMDERLAELQKLLGKGAMAFEILILKSKILST